MTKELSNLLGIIEAVDWQKIKAFRNIIAHDYFGLDAEEVWQIIHGHLPALKSTLQRLIDSNS